MPDMSKFPRGVTGRDLANKIPLHGMWADPNFIAGHDHWQYKPDKVFLGSLGNRLIGASGNRHLMTSAGSRAGKGISPSLNSAGAYPWSAANRYHRMAAMPSRRTPRPKLYMFPR